MALISFGPTVGDCWKKAGWIVRRLIEELRTYCLTDETWTRDSRLLDVFEISRAMKSLHLHSIDPELCPFVIASLKRVCDLILNGNAANGTVWKDGLTLAEQLQFQHAVAELSSMLERWYPDFKRE